MLSDDNIQLMHCVVLSTGLYNIDVNCYNVCKLHAVLMIIQIRLILL